MFLALILALAFALRVIGIGWGLPRTDMHPDEFLVYSPAYECALNHTFEVRDYYRPNHVSVKLDTLVYLGLQNFYFAPKGLDDFEANYKEHLSLFIKSTRLITALFGVGCVVFAYLIASYWGRKQGLLAALFFAVFPSFIEHSHYLIPDIPLLFFFLGVLWMALCYHKKPGVGWVFGMSFFAALATCEKYPGAYACVIIATTVIATNLKKIGTIIKHGLLAILFYILGIMAISPNLIVDYQTVLTVMAGQNKQYHIGADGLNFGETLLFYLKTAVVNMGLILSLCSVYGLVRSIRKNTKPTILLLALFAYIFPISVLKVHWERYTLPIYAIGLILGAVGGCYLLEDLKKLTKEKKVISVFASLLVFVLPFLSLASAAASVDAKFLAPDTRLYLMDEFAAMDVNLDNTVSDCNTPLDPGGFYGAFRDFELCDPAKYKYGSKMFVMTSSAQRDLYLVANPEMYGAVANFYTKLDENYPLVYKYTPVNPSFHLIEGWNIKSAIETINEYAHGTAAGYEIRLYQLEQ